jgi:hypothetical protein
MRFFRVKLLIFLKFDFHPCFRLDGIYKLRKFNSVLIKVLLFVVTCDMSLLQRNTFTYWSRLNLQRL